MPVSAPRAAPACAGSHVRTSLMAAEVTGCAPRLLWRWAPSTSSGIDLSGDPLDGAGVAGAACGALRFVAAGLGFLLAARAFGPLSVTRRQANAALIARPAGLSNGIVQPRPERHASPG